MINYKSDPIRQAISDSWLNKMHDSSAWEEWNWRSQYDLQSMTRDMIEELTEKLKVNSN